VDDDEKPLIVILSEDTVEVIGQTTSSLETIKIVRGRENQAFERYAQECPKREQALSAWRYLNRMYTNPIFIEREPTNLAQTPIGQTARRLGRLVSGEGQPDPQLKNPRAGSAACETRRPAVYRPAA